jgi:hypothetical protein
MKGSDLFTPQMDMARRCCNHKMQPPRRRGRRENTQSSFH